MALQHLRTSTAHKRPIPSVMSAGQLAININEASPGLFFKDSNGDLVKVGPVHIGTDAPNSSPASVAATALVTGTVYQILTVGTSDFTLVGASANTVGTVFTATGTTTGTGTVSGQQGVEKGEQWLDTTGGTYVLKIYDGTAWRSESGTFVNANGDTMTGALLLDNASSAAAPDLSFDGDPNTGIYSPGADQVAISTGGAGRLFIDNVGNVGAGTNSPESKFHARADGNDMKALLYLQNRNGGANSGVQISLSNALNDLSENRLAYIRAINTGSNHNGNHLTFGTNPNGGPPVERMRINSSGNVGIGTSSPTEILEAVATSPTVCIRDSQTSITTATATLRLAESGSGNSLDNYWDLVADNTAGNFGFSIKEGANARIAIKANTGNVGIGTSSPAEPLHIRGSVPSIRLEDTNWSGYHSIKDNANGDLLFWANSSSTGGVSSNIRFQAASAELVRFTSSGNVGIGTSSPITKLEIVEPIGSTTPAQMRFVNTGDRGVTVGFDDHNAAPNFSISSGNQVVKFVSIDSNGKVGINETSPSSTLDVNGSLSKNSGSFKIDHPLPALAETHHLVHSFVEAPDASNLYAGMVDLVDGRATVNIDTAHRMTEGTFEALNTIQSWSSSNESGYAPVKCSISGNFLTIECQDATSTDTVYYEVRGVRKDQHMLDTEWTDENGRVITEPLKSAESSDT